jgi:hypothetical protein
MTRMLYTFLSHGSLFRLESVQWVTLASTIGYNTVLEMSRRHKRHKETSAWPPRCRDVKASQSPGWWFIVAAFASSLSLSSSVFAE